MNNFEKYLKDQGIPEKKEDLFAPLVYEHIHGKSDYFFNVKPLEYSVFKIRLDTTSATPEDYKKLDAIQNTLDKISYKYKRNMIFDNIVIDAMTRSDFDALELYNVWTTASVKEYERLDNKYHTWILNHLEQFNNHIKKIMDYYGNLYKEDKADQLYAPIYHVVNQDFSPDNEDLIF